MVEFIFVVIIIGKFNFVITFNIYFKQAQARKKNGAPEGPLADDLSGPLKSV
jgi:hypothetical protein